MPKRKTARGETTRGTLKDRNHVRRCILRVARALAADLSEEEQFVLWAEVATDFGAMRMDAEERLAGGPDDEPPGA